MVKKMLFRGLLMVMAILAVTSPASAKGQLEKIVISGGNLNHEVVISDLQLLNGFDPWQGNFIDSSRGVIETPSMANKPYEIRFFVSDDTGQSRLIYVIQYAFDKQSSQGFIYLPGRGDAWYTLNTSTIMLDSQDGHWQYSSAGWDRLIQRAIQPSADTKPQATILWPGISWLLLAAGILVIGVVSFLALRLQQRQQAKLQ